MSNYFPEASTGGADTVDENGEKIVVVRAVFKVLKTVGKTTVNLFMDTLGLDDEHNSHYTKYMPVSDGEVNEQDKSLAEYETVIKPGGIVNGYTIADVNGDGKVDSTDYIAVKRHLLGISKLA